MTFIACWVIITKILILLNPPKHRTPDSMFSVCIIENDLPRVKSLDNLKDTDTLCRKKMTSDTSVNYVDYNAIKPVGNEWEVLNYSDSLADPFVYRYRIENNQVIPLWYSYHDTDIWRSLSGFWALLLALIIFSVVKKISKNKKPS